MKILEVNLNPSYPIYFLDHLLESSLLVDFLRDRQEQLLIIADAHLNTQARALEKYLKQFHLSSRVITFLVSEKEKSREMKQQLEDQLFQQQYGRDTCLIALGGGITTDIVGFIGATYCRGISLVYIPTSLLAMVDASIGGKTGVNTPHGKNLVGCFYQPKAVFIDPQFLTTLPKVEYQNGLVELIKHALIADKTLFEQLLSHSYINCDNIMNLIYRSSEIKKNIVEQDEKETGIRQLLNFGHTIGHAIEVLENYQIRHGTAVAMGILVESYLSYQMAFLKQVDFEKILTIIKNLKLPLQSQVFQNISAFKQALMRDKKTKGKQPRFVLLDAIGVPHVEQGTYAMPVSEGVLEEALDWARKNLVK